MSQELLSLWSCAILLPLLLLRIRGQTWCVSAWTLAIVIVGIIFGVAGLFADEDVNHVAGSDELKSDSHKAVVAQMKQILDGNKIVRQSSEPVVEELVPEPILNWDDLARGHHHGTLWIWGSKGRPAAIIEMYTTDFAQKLDRWPGNVAHSLAPEPIRSEGRLHWNWAPDGPIQAERMMDVRSRATSNHRKIQMRSLAKRFSGHETWNGRSELRLLPSPIRVYESASDGILEGGLFALVHGGTNPEVILVLEAIQTKQEKFWQFGCVRLGHAEIQVDFDEKQAWHVDTYDGTSPKSAYYWLATDR